ncbi:hypothetical protein JOQ06_022755 [Pogonophryne albipinna]|uniref:Uncharacterized protein n=1 Tax=Pogonophryne albipinna TaxID=1090488 RepID=A0AAD6F6W3_9TELE|nr:hypothetical protein JOQ06_022755 [Pogonophryne albipinna]
MHEKQQHGCFKLNIRGTTEGHSYKNTQDTNCERQEKPSVDAALHPSDNKKADSFVWLEVNSWEQMMLARLIYVATATVVTRFCYDKDKQMKGEGGRERRKAGRGVR